MLLIPNSTCTHVIDYTWHERGISPKLSHVQCVCVKARKMYGPCSLLQLLVRPYFGVFKHTQLILGPSCGGCLIQTGHYWCGQGLKLGASSVQSSVSSFPIGLVVCVTWAISNKHCQLTIWAWFASWVYDYSLFPVYEWRFVDPLPPPFKNPWANSNYGKF